MKNYTDTVLFKTHQHAMLIVGKCLTVLLPFAFILWLLMWAMKVSIYIQWIIVLLSIVVIIAWHYFFWKKSYFIITNEKIAMKVRNGLFSKFHMSIHYKNIRDTAFAKNNIIHYACNYGTLFARSSAGAAGDFEARAIPDVEKVYKIINALHNYTEPERREIISLDQLRSVTENTISPSKETLTEAMETEANVLLAIQWIQEVIVLNDADRVAIFEKEEERNHGVFEALRKDVLFAVTHDSSFRQPDQDIVMKTWDKVIFPIVEFHELDRPTVVSSSPGLEVHEYLIDKFKNIGEYDATLLIGFDK